MKTAYTYTLMALLASLCACTKDGGMGDATDRKESVTLRIHSDVQAQAAATKSESMMNDGNIGLFVCKHSEPPYVFDSYDKGMNNMAASVKGGTWSFCFSGSTVSYPELVITAKRDDEENSITADVFAYAPYNGSASNLESIPFKLADCGPDLMYARENADTGANKDIDPCAVDELGRKIEDVDVELHFRHVLSKLQFKFEKVNMNYNHPDGGDTAGLSIGKITLSVQNGGKLYSSGRFNAMTGVLYDLQTTNSLTFGKTEFVIVPTQAGDEYKDDQYVFSFTIDGKELPSDSSKFYLKRSQIMHHDGSGLCGFQPGYIYTFNFKYDNFVRLKGIEIDDWTLQAEPLDSSNPKEI